MTRVFWDSMVFIYLLQDDPIFGERAAFLRKRSLERGDLICTSALAIGEILAGVYRDRTPEDAAHVRTAIEMSGVRILPFDSGAIDPFGRIRSQHRTTAADTIHLACAASFGVDLFLTNDDKLRKLNVPGIKFIAGINTDLL